ncbi:12355_t:CDS:2, partial [Racocetra persica]
MDNLIQNYTSIWGQKLQQSGERLLDYASTVINLEGNNTNRDDTNEEQNIENDEGSSGLIQDIANRDVEILSQEGESLD